jgi:hypothetical protein
MSGGSWFGDISDWAGRQSWLPGFLGGGSPPLPEAFGPKPPADLQMYGPPDPDALSAISQTSSMGGAKTDRSRIAAQLARYQQALRPQSGNRMTEWFGPRRIR